MCALREGQHLENQLPVPDCVDEPPQLSTHDSVPTHRTQQNRLIQDDPHTRTVGDGSLPLAFHAGGEALLQLLFVFVLGVDTQHRPRVILRLQQAGDDMRGVLADADRPGGQFMNLRDQSGNASR